MEQALVPYLSTRTLINYGSTSRHLRDYCFPVVNGRRRMHSLRIALLRYRYLQMFGDTVPSINSFYYWKIDRNVLRMIATLRVFNDAVELAEEHGLQRIFLHSMKGACEIYGEMRKKNQNELFFLCI